MARITGTNNGERLDGTKEADEINLLDGDDTCVADLGDDIVYGGSGNDTILGRYSGTYTVGDDGNDLFFGEAGNDSIWGGTGSDKLDGGTGNDNLNGDEGNDTLDGGAGNDDLSGGVGNDIINGGSGNDSIIGGSGNDTIFAGAGSDIFWADYTGVKTPDGDDTFYGDEGDDQAYAGTGNDKLDGGAGNDILNGDEGNDNLDGGTGNDDLSGGDGNDTINGGSGIDKIYAGNGDDKVIADQLDFINGGDGIDTLVIAGKRSDYAITNNDFATTLKSSTSNFTVFCFEKFQFDDGTYNLSTFGLSPINYFDLSIEEKLKVVTAEFPALVVNDQKINKTTITYSFANADFDHWAPYVPAGEKFVYKSIPENFRLQIRESFEYLNTYLNVKFVEVTDSSSVDVRMGSHNMTQGGYAGSPNQLYINSNYINDGLGDSGLGIFLHELGHLLQLDHSANNSEPGEHDGKGSSGKDISANIDTDIFTVMSYNNYIIDNQTSTTYSPADVAALQYLYGKNSSQVNNTFTFYYDPALKAAEFQKLMNSVDGSNFTVFAYAPFLVIDNSGFDTLDFSNLKISSTIDLTLGNVYIDNRTLMIDQLDSSTWFTVDETAPAITIYPESVIEKIIGTSFDDQILGNTLPLTISSGAGNDNIVGSNKNDLISGGTGNDTIDGGSGKDTAVFLSKSSSYKYINNGATWTVTNSTTEVGTDNLTNIEIIQFTDLSIALDLNGNAGTTAKILGAVFGKESLNNKNYVGIGLHFLDAGWSYDNLAALALDAAGAKTNEQVVSLLWNNVFGTKSTATDKQPFIALLENGMSAGALAHLAADTSFNTTNINLVGLAQTGIEYIPVG